MMLGASLGPGPFSLDTEIETTHLQIILEVDVLKEGVGVFEKRPRDAFLEKIDK